MNASGIRRLRVSVRMRRLKIIVAFVAIPVFAVLLLEGVASVYRYLYCTEAGVSVEEAEALARAAVQRHYPQLPIESWVAVERFDEGLSWWITLSSGACRVAVQIHECGEINSFEWPAGSSCPPDS